MTGSLALTPRATRPVLLLGACAATAATRRCCCVVQYHHAAVTVGPPAECPATFVLVCDVPDGAELAATEPLDLGLGDGCTMALFPRKHDLCDAFTTPELHLLFSIFPKTERQNYGSDGRVTTEPIIDPATGALPAAARTFQFPVRVRASHAVRVAWPD